MNFLLSLFSAIAAIPQILSAFKSIFAEWNQWQKDKEITAINKATQEAADAGAKKDDAALGKALDDTLNATHDL